MFVCFCKKKTAYESGLGLVGSEMCIKGRVISRAELAQAEMCHRRQLFRRRVVEQLRQQRRNLEPAARLLHCSVCCGQPSVVHTGGVPEGIKNMLLAVESV